MLFTGKNNKTMTLLPFASYTDDELIRVCLVKNDISDLELELVHRLERAKEELVERENGDNP